MQLGRRKGTSLRAAPQLLTRNHHPSSSSSSSSWGRHAFTMAFGLCLLLVPLSMNIIMTKKILSNNGSSLSTSSSSSPFLSEAGGDAGISNNYNNNNEMVAPATTISTTTTSTTTTTTTSSSSSNWQSQNSAVLAIASGLGMGDYQRFVGSLRATGYSGHILLGISKQASPDILDYLSTQRVTTHFIEPADQCTFHNAIGSEGKPIDTIHSHEWHCPKNYPDYKITWARFFMYEDWLNECPSCTDGIMLTDARDAFFQADPFVTAVKLGQQYPLMLFEEHPNMSNTHWLTDIPIKKCRNYTVGPTRVFCSGSIMGSRGGIMEYLDSMQKEMTEWMTMPNCRIDMRGDDQSIHNYLYYTNQLKNATAIPHRTGAIHVVGYEAARIFETAQEDAKAQGSDSTTDLYVRDNNWHNWLPNDPIAKFDHEIQANSTYNINLIDRNTGQLLNHDGSPSAQVHQYDRFSPLMAMWFYEMEKNNWPYNNASK